MIRILMLLNITVLFFSCGTTKKIFQTEEQSKTNVQTTLLDTSKNSATWEGVVNSVVKEIDLSNIIITTYYHKKDTAGKQLIKEVILIDNNRSVTDSNSVIISKKEEGQNGVSVHNSLIEEKITSVTTSKGRSSTSLKTILFIGVGLCLIALIAFKYLLRKL